MGTPDPALAGLRHRSPRRRWPVAAGRLRLASGGAGRAVALGVGLALAALTLVTRDVHYLLTQPYWLDEAWVAVGTRLPVTDLGQVISSTPVGWAALLRLVGGGDGGQRQRLVPLGFSAAAVLAAYWLGWRVPVRRVPRLLVAVLTGTAALLAPTGLIRVDLKQYTAEAFGGLLLLAVLAGVDTYHHWRRGLIMLASVAAVGPLFGYALVFSGCAALAALALLTAYRRQWRRLVECAVAGALAVLAMLAVYLLVARPRTNDRLADYWAGYRLPLRDGWSATGHFLAAHAGVLAQAGLGPPAAVGLLVGAGLVVLVRSGRPAVAVAVVLLVGELLVAGAAGAYPLLETRTSHHVVVVLAVCGALGAAGLAGAAADATARLGGVAARARSGAVASGAVASGTAASGVAASGTDTPGAGRSGTTRAPAVVGVAVAVALAGAFIAGSAGRLRSHPIPDEDVRWQAAYVTARWRPGDLIVVNYGASYGFGYYYPTVPAVGQVSIAAVGFAVRYPDRPWIRVCDDRSPEAVQRQTRAVRQWLAADRRGRRVWIVREHQQPEERRAWLDGLGGLAVVHIRNGADSLLLVVE